MQVVNAEAGPLSTIDYSRSDLWTAGTMAYEIFGGKNPFYSQQANLKNSSYKETNLPSLPLGTPVAIQKLVKEMLCKDPKKVSCLYLFLFSMWLLVFFINIYRN